MAKKKNKKVVRYRRPLNINVGMIIFALIFLYMAFYLYTYLHQYNIVTENGQQSVMRDEEIRGC